MPEQDSTAEAQTDPTENDGHSLNRPRSQIVHSLVDRLISERYQRIFVPPPAHEQLSEGEEVQVEIHLAWYRNFISVMIYGYTPALLVITAAFSFLGWLMAPATGLEPNLAAIIPFALLIALACYGLFERFQYLQWRLIKTNKRIIISMPQPDAWYLVDTIEMNSMPKVLDANWSDNGLRRLLQALTGARDLHISLVGLEFEKGTAKVKNAIVIPDVPEEETRQLKQIVFK